MPPHTRLIQVEIAEEELGKNYAADIAICGDLRSVLKQMFEAAHDVLKKGSNLTIVEQRWLRVTGEIKEVRKAWMEEWKDHQNSNAALIDPYRITTELMKILDPDRSTILHDAGLCGVCICHHFVSQCPGSFVGFGGFSARCWFIIIAASMP